MAEIVTAKYAARGEAVRRLRPELEAQMDTMAALRQRVEELEERCRRAESGEEAARALGQLAPDVEAVLRDSMQTALHEAGEEVAHPAELARERSMLAESPAVPQAYGRDSDLFRKKRISLAASLATFENREMVQAEIVPNSKNSRSPPQHGRWRYDPVLGKAVRYATAPVIEG